MNEDQFFRMLHSQCKTSDGRWIRGLVIDAILAFHQKIATVPGMVWSMTEDIPQRPTDEEVIDLIINYTTLPGTVVRDKFRTSEIDYMHSVHTSETPE